MPSVKDKMYKRRRSLAIVRRASGAGIVNTTLANAVAVGATTVTLTSATNAAIGKIIYVGTGETLERHDIIGLVGAVATLQKRIKYAHEALERVHEAVAYNMGATKGGFTVDQAQEQTEETADENMLTYSTWPGYSSMGVSTTILGITLPVICVALGISFARIFGNGTDADDPLNLATDLGDVDSVDDICIVETSTLQDGMIRTQEFWQCGTDFTAVTMQLATGQPGAVPVKFSVYGKGMAYDGAAPFVENETYRATKGKLFGDFRGAGYFTPASGAVATTVSAAAAADATELTVDDATDIPAQSWVLVNVEDRVETHWVLSKAGDVLTLKTSLLRAQGVGARVVRATRVRFASITKDGATFSTSGSRSDLAVADRRLPVGGQPVSVSAGVAFAVQSLALADRARALGIPVSEIGADGVLDLTESLGRQPIEALYVEGGLRDGVTVNVINLWGCSQDLASLSSTFGGGNTTTQPFGGKPASGIQFMQYPA